MTNKTQLSLILIGTAVICGLFAQSSLAIMGFQKQFLALYVDKNDSKEFVTLVKKQAKCFVCHDAVKLNDKGKLSKKFRNPYGQQLSKLLDKKTDKKNIEKIRKAMGQVAKMKADPKATKDSKGPTFGDRIKQGKLPVDLPKKKASAGS